ncbi:flagellar biosynthetic protein FlhB, partial [Enterococcus hirae]
MAEESDLEKSESPTPRRLEKAREEGQVARSRELSTFALLAAGVAGMWMTADRISQGFAQLMRHGMQFEP